MESSSSIGCLMLVLAIAAIGSIVADPSDAQDSRENRVSIPATQTASLAARSDWFSSAGAQLLPVSPGRGAGQIQSPSLLATLPTETFLQSALQMIDWESNYGLVVTNNQPIPTLPESIDYILASRRFAKLVGELRADQTGAHHTKLLDLITSDLSNDMLYIKLDSGHISLAEWVARFVDPEQLIIPLTYRLNATLLLLSQDPAASNLSAAIAYANVLKSEKREWAIAAFAVSTVLDRVDRAKLSESAQHVFDRYIAMLKDPAVLKVMNVRQIVVPTVDVKGAGSDQGTSGLTRSNADSGKLIMLGPGEYRLLVRSNRTEETYYDVDKGNAINQKVVEIGRDFLRAQP